MPFRKFKKKPTQRPKKRVYKRRPMISKSLRPAVLPIQRDITHFVDSSYPSLPTGWRYGNAGTHYNTLQLNQIFKLGQLDNTSEFTNLFKLYKLNCVIVTITPLHNTSQNNGTLTSLPTYFGGTTLCYTQKNITGIELDSSIEQSYWDQTPAKKTITFYNGRPRSFKIYPKILNTVQLAEGTTENVPRKSGWLPTTTDGMDIQHHGINMQFSYINPREKFRVYADPMADDGSAPMIFRVNYKFLMQFRGIK